MRKTAAIVNALSLCALMAAQDGGAETFRYAVRLSHPDCSTAELDLSGGAIDGENEFPMAKEGSWWKVEFSAGEEIEFNLALDGRRYPPLSGRSWRLSTVRSAWIREGIIYPYDPDDAKAKAEHLSVLSVNLHTWQEEDARARLSTVARLIAVGQVDIAAFQECAQNRGAAPAGERYGVPIRADNAAKIVADELKAAYGLSYAWRWDWAHYGFGEWEEGVAVLGRKEWFLDEGGPRYISASSSKASIDSRMAIASTLAIPGFGRVRILSTHVSWGAPQVAQLKALKDFAAEGGAADAIIVCGDFNMKYRDSGYSVMTFGKAWLDAYALPAPWGEKDGTLASDRIDYQFLSAASALVPVLSQRVFLDLGGPEAAFSRVSDHCGVLVSYRRR